MLCKGENMPQQAPITSYNPNSRRTWLEWIMNAPAELIAGKPELIHMLHPFTENQGSILDYLLESGKEQLQNPYKGFEPIKQSALSSFFQEIVPALSERFSASGSNASSSPVLHSQLSGAGASLAERLAAMQASYGQQERGNALSQLQLGLNPRTQFLHSPSTGGLAHAAAGIGGDVLGKYLSNRFLP